MVWPSQKKNQTNKQTPQQPTNKQTKPNQTKNKQKKTKYNKKSPYLFSFRFNPKQDHFGFTNV